MIFCNECKFFENVGSKYVCLNPKFITTQSVNTPIKRYDWTNCGDCINLNGNNDCGEFSPIVDVKLVGYAINPKESKFKEMWKKFKK